MLSVGPFCIHKLLVKKIASNIYKTKRKIALIMKIKVFLIDKMNKS